MSDELKPCPFCGGEASHDYDNQSHYVIGCSDPDCLGHEVGLHYINDKSRSTLVDEWNTRAQPTIADCLKANEAMLTKTKAKMVSIESLKEFAGLCD